MANTWTDINGDSLGIGQTLTVNLSTSTIIYANISGGSEFTLSDSIVITIVDCFTISLTGLMLLA